MRILFICTGNTCRSPMAYTLAKKAFSEKGINVDLDCAGIMVSYSESASKNALEAMRLLGCDLSAHLSKQVTPEMLKKADLILTMTNDHKQRILSAFDFCLGKTYTLYEYANKSQKDILDPYLHGIETYKLCAKEISEAIDMIVENFKPVAIGSDHGGFELKKEIIKHLTDKNITFIDFGTNSTESCDYPVFAKKVAKSVLSGECSRGIIICGTGIGVSITANKIKGIRCALCGDVFSAQQTRLHNDANMLALGARVIGTGTALLIVDTFLETEFSNDQRHKRRIALIEEE